LIQHKVPRARRRWDGSDRDVAEQKEEKEEKEDAAAATR
jgi:hypothetical protein